MLKPDGFEMHGDAHGRADCTVQATASNLCRTVWNRGNGQAGLEVEGDPSVLDAWWESMKPAWR